jgi:excisionase family DNA binding protein
LLRPNLFRLCLASCESPEAAHYIGGTNWCVEELVRGKRIPFLVVGKYRVIDIRDLDKWIEREKERQATAQQAEAA